ncbi:hypothetical protein AB1N83_002585 [Pleurotus pulmonarius]
MNWPFYLSEPPESPIGRTIAASRDHQYYSSAVVPGLLNSAFRTSARVPLSFPQSFQTVYIIDQRHLAAGLCSAISPIRGPPAGRID